MSAKKISALATAISLDGSELATGLQGGVNKNMEAQDIADLGPVAPTTLSGTSWSLTKAVQYRTKSLSADTSIAVTSAAGQTAYLIVDGNGYILTIAGKDITTLASGSYTTIGLQDWGSPFGLQVYDNSGAGGSTKLATPTLSATVISSSEIDLSWTNIANETNYQLQRSPDNVTFTTIASPAANTTTYNDTGLSASTLYYYRIKAIGDGTTYTDSDYSTVVSGTTQSGGITEPFLVFDMAGGQPTESPTGTWNFTAPDLTTTTTKTNGDFTFLSKFVNIATNDSIILGVSTNPGQVGFNEMVFAFYVSSAGLTPVDGNVPGSAIEAGIDGAYYRIKRVSGATKLAKSTNNGASWVDLYTYSATTSSDLYAKIQCTVSSTSGSEVRGATFS